MTNALAIPNNSGYVIKKEDIETICNSKMSDEQKKRLIDNATIFVRNNLNKTK